MNSLLPRHGPTILKNKSCIYCGINLPKAEATKEHVIGRRFVPKGMLENQWNLIANCCRKCNLAKSGLEDDISAITLGLLAGSIENDPLIVAEAKRKLELSYSRKTKKLVANSGEKLNFTSPFAGGEVSFGCVGPPQMEVGRINELCRLHLTGFFYLITFNEEYSKGRPLPGTFCPMQETAHSDWGNQVNVAFMKTVLEWQPRVVGSAANGFFKIAIRRHASKDLWSWAIEWNKSFRSIGFFGDYDAAEEIVKHFPKLVYNVVLSNAKEVIRSRLEISLAEAEDIMFAQKGLEESIL